jgi:hypothetical protein
MKIYQWSKFQVLNFCDVKTDRTIFYISKERSSSIFKVKQFRKCFFFGLIGPQDTPNAHLRNFANYLPVEKA